MPGRKKKFPCGHAGKGQYCHRCAQVQASIQQSHEERKAWADRVRTAPVPLDDSIPRRVAEKVLQIIAELAKGKPYQDFRGKRLVTLGQREVISVPIGWSYRLICRETCGRLEYLEVISHETYNRRLSDGGWE